MGLAAFRSFHFPSVMFDGAVLLAVVVLTLSAIAKSQGFAVPIQKRSALTLPNGVFDHDKAAVATLRTKYKHRRNLINLQRNLRLDVLPSVTALHYN